MTNIIRILALTMLAILATVFVAMLSDPALAQVCRPNINPACAAPAPLIGSGIWVAVAMIGGYFGVSWLNHKRR